MVYDDAIASANEYAREHNANRDICGRCEGHLMRNWATDDDDNRVENITEYVMGCGMKSALVESKCEDCKHTIHYWQECS